MFVDVWTRALPCPDLHARKGCLHLLNCNLSQLLGQSPHVTLWVHNAAGAVTVELVSGLLDYLAASGTRAFAVFINAAIQMNRDGLRVRASEGAGGLDVLPLAADLDQCVPEGQLGIHDFAIGTCGQ